MRFHSPNPKDIFPVAVAKYKPARSNQDLVVVVPLQKKAHA